MLLILSSFILTTQTNIKGYMLAYRHKYIYRMERKRKEGWTEVEEGGDVSHERGEEISTKKQQSMKVGCCGS